jgi:hypothetical protein
LTILDVTKFYLGVDPADPKFIRSYRRNLLYIPEARWHLGLMSGEIPGSEQAILRYNKVSVNHDAIMKSLLVGCRTEVDKNNIPLLNHVEIKTILDEGLEDFFAEEMQSVVRHTSLVRLHVPVTHSHSLRGWRA